jgi:hypothetical protein
MTGVAAAAPKRAWRQKERILILELGRHSGDSTLQWKTHEVREELMK